MMHIVRTCGPQMHKCSGCRFDTGLHICQCPLRRVVLQELLKKRRFGRLTKALGDYALLAGSPADATAKYQAAADLARASSDFIWAGASLEGLAHARVSSAAMYPDQASYE